MSKKGLLEWAFEQDITPVSPGPATNSIFSVCFFCEKKICRLHLEFKSMTAYFGGHSVLYHSSQQRQVCSAWRQGPRTQAANANRIELIF